MNKQGLHLFCAALIGSFLLVSTSVGAQSRNTQQMDADLSAVQQQMGQVQQDMKKLRRLLDNRGLLELFQRMDELSEEVSSLRGMLEQQNHDLAGLKKRQRELYLDTDRRLRELEITSSRAPAAAAPAMTTPKPAAAPTAPQAPMQKPTVVTPPPTSVTAPVAVTPVSKKPYTGQAKAATTMSEERAAYQKAFDMLKEGRYKSANAAFRRFVAKYPDSSYAGNSQYWLGESNYVTRQFDQAVKEFEAVLSKYPSSNKVPDAMLKLGYTYYELHQFDAAQAILAKLRQQYPKSTAARLAGKRLDRMRKEGH
jgi:tol-pal system protein YbgF